MKPLREFIHPSTGTPAKWKPASSQFPLNQNELSLLKETRISVKRSVTAAVRWYGQQARFNFENGLDSQIDFNRTEEIVDTSDDGSSQNNSLFSDPGTKSSSPIEDDGSISSATGKSVLKNSEMARQVEYNDTRIRLQQLIAEVLNVTDMEEDVANYTINGIMCHNDFVNLRLKPFKPIRKDVRTPLVRLIRFLYPDCYLTKHRERFFDEVTHGLSEYPQHLENPKWFELFVAIWRFDPESFELYDEEYFEDYMSTQSLESNRLRIYHNQLVREGFFMNLGKYRHYFSSLRNNFLNYGMYGLSMEDDEEEESLDDINKRYIYEYNAIRELAPSIKFCEDIKIQMFDDTEPPSSTMQIVEE